MSMSNYLENKVLNHILGIQVYPRPQYLNIALFLNTSGNTASNLEQGILTDEVSGGTMGSPTSYTRYPIQFGSPTFFDVGRASGGIISNWDKQSWDIATADWGTLTHFAILDYSDVLFWASLDSPIFVKAGDRVSFNVGTLKIQLS